MEASTVQAMARDFEVKPASQKGASHSGPPGDFGSMVEELIAVEEEQETVSSEDVTPDLGKAEEQEANAGEEASSLEAPLVVALQGLAREAAPSGQGTAPDPIGKEVAPGLAELTPKPADDYFAEAIARLVAGEGPVDKAQQGNPQEVVPRPAVAEFTEALAQVVTEGPPGEQPPDVSAQGAPAGPATGELDESMGQAAALDSDAGDQQQAVVKNMVHEKLWEVSEVQAEASSLTNTDGPEDTANTAPLPSTPKEAVEVEALRLASSEESTEVEIEPIKPLDEANVPQPDDRPPQGLEAARSLSQSHAMEYSSEASASGKLPSPPSVGRIVEKLVEVVQAGGPKERHEVSIQLDPPSLGRVHLKLLVEDSKLHVAIYTTTNEAKDLVEANASQLKTALHQHGLALDQFSVEVQSGLAQNMAQQDWSAWLESFSHGSGFGVSVAGTSDGMPSAQPWLNRSPDPLSTIDLFI
jgi:flagellar hook-length control protein FliK